MTRVVLPFPVLPGKTESDIRGIAERFKAEPEAYWESRRGAGVTLERVYWQQTPMGDFVVAYVESEKSVPEAMAAYAHDSSEPGRFFREKMLEIHGIDMTQPPPGASPETIGEWADPQIHRRGSGFAFCAPLIPEAEEKGKQFTRDAYSSEGMTESRRALRQNLEVVTLNQTPQGPVIAVYVEGRDPFQSNQEFAASQRPFDVWFKEQLKQIFPPHIDFGQPVPGITEIFNSEAVGSGGTQ